MKTTQSTHKTVESLYQAAVTGDEQLMLSLVDVNVVIHEPAFLPYGGDYSGYEGLGELFPQLAAFLDLSTLKVMQIVADGESAVATIEVNERNHGTSCLISEHHQLQDGKIIDIRIFYFNPPEV